MRFTHRYLFLITIVAVHLLPVDSRGDDLLITGTISGTQNYDSTEGIVVENAVVVSTAAVAATSTYEVRIKTSSNINNGAYMLIKIKDPDGMSNRCEMRYFGDLTHRPNVDDDGDQLTNIQECKLGTNPAQNNPDSDGDGIPDWWEVKHFGLDLGHRPEDDYDGDRLTNLQEYQLGLDAIDGVIDSDRDRLPDWWEVKYFGLDLTHEADVDEDGNGLTNYDEYMLGLNPTDGAVDSDGDGLPDAWEVQYFGYDLSQDADDDSDGDGVANSIEHIIKTNPADNDLPGTGINLIYDEYGRIKTIYRLPN